MKILITGATGFVAQTLVPLLVKNNHKLVILTRSPQKAKTQWGNAFEYYAWDAHNEAPPKEAFDGIEAVLHLAGEGIADRRWSKKQKTKILESRTLGTQHLVEGLKQHLKSPLEVFVSTSAIGYYPESDFSKPLTETSPKGEGFLANVCDAWEKAADATSIAKRQVVIRTGVVLGTSGGALKKMLPIFSLGLGGPLGLGKAYFSFIHELDLARIYLAALTQSNFNGVYNATAPFPVTNKQMTEKLAEALNRPALFPVPPLALRLAFGEMSQILLNSQCVVPKKLLNQNFEFLYPTLESALKEIFPKIKAPGSSRTYVCHKFVRHQMVPAPLSEVFGFFSEASNLEKITPKEMNFKITKMNPDRIREQTLIDYTLRVRGIPLRWQTLIEHFNPNQSFTDTQLKGPYLIWQHTHTFSAYGDFTFMTDSILYRLPLGFLGDLCGLALVKKDLKKIFDYRLKIIKEIFKPKS